MLRDAKNEEFKEEEFDTAEWVFKFAVMFLVTVVLVIILANIAAIILRRTDSHKHMNYYERRAMLYDETEEW